jgi:hypothetical protein
MPLARLAQYQHCLLRRNGVRTNWSRMGACESSLADQLALLRLQWRESVDCVEPPYGPELNVRSLPSSTQESRDGDRRSDSRPIL